MWSLYVQIENLLQAGADAEALERCCFLACSACFLVELRTKSHDMLGLPPSVIKLRKCSTCLPTAQSQGGIFHSKVPPLRWHVHQKILLFPGSFNPVFDTHTYCWVSSIRLHAPLGKLSTTELQPPTPRICSGIMCQLKNLICSIKIHNTQCHFSSANIKLCVDL